MKNQEVTLRQYVPNLDEFTHVIGVDEVGWGAIAGPIVVAATVLPVDFDNPGFKDSKRFTTDSSRLRGAVFAKENVLEHVVVFAEPDDIYKHGPASTLSYLQRKIVYPLLQRYPKALIVVDGNQPIKGPSRSVQLALPRADSYIAAVSAASIIAKVARDTRMMELGDIYPEWDFHKNKGYPTPPHMKKLKELGPTYQHRMNVGHVQIALDKKGWYAKEDTRAAEERY